MQRPTPSRIFLIGMMGSGKSTVGNRLAALLAVPHLDNDALLASEEGRDLVAVAALGTQRLHDAEARVAAGLAKRQPPFVADIAASVVERAEVVAALRAGGLVVYLRARAATLEDRVRASARPFVGQPGWLQATLDQRGRLFERAAQLVIDTDDVSPDDLAATIAHEVRSVENRPSGRQGR